MNGVGFPDGRAAGGSRADEAAPLVPGPSPPACSPPATVTAPRQCQPQADCCCQCLSAATASTGSGPGYRPGRAAEVGRRALHAGPGRRRAQARPARWVAVAPARRPPRCSASPGPAGGTHRAPALRRLRARPNLRLRLGFGRRSQYPARAAVTSRVTVNVGRDGHGPTVTVTGSLGAAGSLSQ